ncbi:MAG: SUMF1/EgtB/PvdO family nonheme iron enzyme [Opitutales bacterium]
MYRSPKSICALWAIFLIAAGSTRAADGYYFARTASEIRTTLTRAILAIEETHKDAYPGERFLEELATLSDADYYAIKNLQRKALLSNPSLDFTDILLIERVLGERAREADGRNLGLAKGNYNSLAQSQRNGWDTSIIRLKNVFSDTVERETVYHSEHGGNINYVDLHYDAERIMFSMSRPKDRAYRLFEMDLRGGSPVELGPDDGSDVDHFDGVYLPDGGIIFASTATFLGMPCINGIPRMASLYRMEKDRQTVRQLGFDQDTSWYPTMLQDGRVMYTRWEYSDMQHSNNRVLMVMNPDGSGQKSIAFSNSYFPASFFYARPIPGHPSQIVGTISGHHGPMRVGRMIVIDPAVHTQNEKAVVRELPGYNKKVKRVVKDPLMHDVMPQILHPFPLAQEGTHAGAGEFFLVSMQRDFDLLRGIYLVDIYDNAVLLWEEEGKGFLEPIPLRKQTKPPVIPSLIKPDSDEATIYVQDIYHGPGLKDIPRGTVKQLRIGTYQFSPHGGAGGHPGTIGVDSGWDVKTVIGVTPVNEDGSLTAKIPSKTPLFFQPLDKHGQALQGMRSWATAMGGERMSCVGCHEPASDMPRPTATLASIQEPKPLTTWLDIARPISFAHEIQPILDANCVSCHDGQASNGRFTTRRPEFADGIPDLRATPINDYENRSGGAANPIYGGKFTESYMTLHSLVRHPGTESPMDVPNPGEYGAIVSELTQILEKGHHGVVLTEKELLHLKTWMDYNAPFHGYRRDLVQDIKHRTINREKLERTFARGNELSQKYAGRDNFVHLDPPEAKAVLVKHIQNPVTAPNTPSAEQSDFSVEVTDTQSTSIQIDLGDGELIDMLPIPSGTFTMGSNLETQAEAPRHSVKIEKAFWMSSKEITNQQLRHFVLDHNSRMEDRLNLQFGQEGISVNGDELPAVRVSWKTAMAFCEWLSEKTGYCVSLPSEAQWEWAARAGRESSFWYGELNTDFSTFANLSDASMKRFGENTASGSPRYTKIVTMTNPNRHEMWIPYIEGVNDGQQIQTSPGTYLPNPWGLYDMHGNVAEWTRSVNRPYPFVDSNSSSADDPQLRRVVRGGSYRDRPYRATASYRLAYHAWQKVHDVGFRIVIEEKDNK